MVGFVTLEFKAVRNPAFAKVDMKKGKVLRVPSIPIPQSIINDRHGQPAGI